MHQGIRKLKISKILSRILSKQGMTSVYQINLTERYKGVKIIKSIVLFLVILIVGLFHGCNYKSNETNNINVVNLDSTNFDDKVDHSSESNILPFAKEGGINIGLYNENGEIEKDYNFNIREKEKISKYISVGNMIDTERIYKLLLFVDYKQKDFNVDGRSEKTDFTFKLNPNQAIKIPVSISPLDKGLHDILFVIVKYPDIKSLDEKYRKQTDMNNLLFLRFSVVVDKEVNRDITLNEYGDTKNNSDLDGVFITKENNYKRWLTQNISMKSDLQYYIHIGNNHNKGNKKYALIALFDWKQINILAPDKKVAFFQLNDKQEIILDSNIRMDKNAGIYDLSVILIHNPFEKCTIKNKEVETGMRVGINVK